MINHLVALYAIISAKFGRYDSQVKMALAVFGTRMTGVQVALVLNQQFRGRKLCLELLADHL